MAAFLVPLQPGACVIPLEKAILLIGRQADCDVSLTASRKISRKHCCIAIVNESVVVRDLGSTNGVSINGDRIEQEGRLRLGDELSIGDVRFRLQKDAKLPPPPAAPTPEQIPNRALIDDDSMIQGRRTVPEENMNPGGFDFPVALAEEGRDFAVEATYQRMKPVAKSAKMEGGDSGPLVPFYPADDLDVLPMPKDSI